MTASRRLAERFFLGALGIASLAACGSAPYPPSRAERDAVAANQRAARAYQQGDLARAKLLYEESLRIDLALENAEGIAVNLLSLAGMEQAAGRADAAHALLDRVLADEPRALPASRKAEAAARKAQLYLTANETATAAEWSARAEALCESCGVRPVILNIRALAAMNAGDPSGALALASRALEASSEGAKTDAPDPRLERANALRTIGEARLLQGDSRATLTIVGEALALDQALGLPQRIFRDLMLLGRAAGSLGQHDEARNYYRRALSVASASRDSAAQEQARVRLSVGN